MKLHKMPASHHGGWHVGHTFMHVLYMSRSLWNYVIFSMFFCSLFCACFVHSFDMSLDLNMHVCRRKQLVCCLFVPSPLPIKEPPPSQMQMRITALFNLPLLWQCHSEPPHTWEKYKVCVFHLCVWTSEEMSVLEEQFVSKNSKWNRL